MPNLFLEPYEENGAQIDPAADIAAFLLEPDTKEQPHGFHHGAPTAFSTSADTPAAEKQQIAERTEALDELVKLYLRGTLTESEIEQTYAAKKIVRSLDQLSGDEVELAVEKDHGNVSDAQWTQMKLNYVGRRTISRYGCYGCHDIPGFETARPIGTALQDWGRKDTSKLALEHIEEFLHHHGEADGSSTLERVKSAMTKAQGGGAAAGQFVSEEQEERELTAAYFFDSLLHHGRPGFLWQKLRQPRSYDYMKTGTKRYDERLRMPKFPLSEPQIEAIATFVLGLVVEPPASEYLYQPEGAALARNEGELLLDKYNCTGCHMIDLPEIRYGVDPESLMASKLAAGDFPEGLELLHQLKPQQSADTGETMEVSVDGEASTLPVIRFRGLIASRPDPLDDLVDQEFTYDLWEPLKVGDKLLNPATRMIVPKTQLAPGSTGQNGYAKQARGGHFTEWLVDQLMETTTGNNRNLAWQMAPPPLYKEGIKVQTPWLYQFLRDPGRIRHTTVLRMPRFNMSSDEAQKLADYFAAVDDARYPYQRIPQREPDYLAARNQELHAQLEQQGTTYLEESWKLLNAPLCIKCHSLGGREVKISDPKKDIRGPTLELATERLRPDWTLLWLYKPVWLTPYTSMPTNLPRDQKQFTEFFHGDASLQTKAIRDALMNYNRLMEQQGKVVTDTSTPTPNAGGGE